MSQIYKKEALWLVLCKTFAWTNLKKLKNEQTGLKVPVTQEFIISHFIQS